MSTCICESCDRPIDSDADPHCFIDNPYNSRDTRIICEPCRERAWEQYEADAMSEPPMSVREQHIAAWNKKQLLK